MIEIAKGSLKDLIFQIQPAWVQCFSLKVSTELSTMFCSAHLQHQTSTSTSAIGNKSSSPYHHFTFFKEIFKSIVYYEDITHFRSKSSSTVILVLSGASHFHSHKEPVMGFGQAGRGSCMWWKGKLAGDTQAGSLKCRVAKKKQEGGRTKYLSKSRWRELLSEGFWAE